MHQPAGRPAAFAIIGLGLLPAAAGAGSVTVEVKDRDGQPVPEVAVYALPAAPAASGGAPRERAAMNQRGLAFDPHILVVETGTVIDFPNSDDVRHHVYSFSPAKAFDFSIEAGKVEPGLSFDVAGLVTLGCNVHDDMLGFILVVDTPYFGKTDGAGAVEMTDLPPGTWELRIYTPRVAAKNLPAPIPFELDANESITLRHRFENRLFPPHAHSETSLHWSHY